MFLEILLLLVDLHFVSDRLLILFELLHSILHLILVASAWVDKLLLQRVLRLFLLQKLLIVIILVAFLIELLLEINLIETL